MSGPRTSCHRDAPSAARTAQVAAAHRRPHEHEAGHVGARDEQHQADRRQQQHHPRAHTAHEPLLQRHHARGAAGRPVRVLPVEGRSQPRHLPIRLRHADARLQPPDGAVEVGVTAVARSLGVAEGQRDVEVGGPRRADRVGESGWRNADDLPRLLVQVERPANDVRRAAELLLPVRVAEDDDTVASDHFVVRHERPAEDGCDTQDRKELPRDRLRRRVDRFARRGARAEGHVARRGQVLERRLMASPVEIRRGRREAAAERVGRPRVALDDGDDAPGIVERQSSKHDAVDDREDGGGGADAEREHTDGDERERGRLPESPNRGAEIVDHREAFSFRLIRRKEEPAG